MTVETTRRDFLKLTGLFGAGLVLGLRLDTAAAGDGLIQNMARPNGQFEPNAYIHIGTDGIITMQVHRSEMGQGVNTSVAMILAEELEADWSMIRIEQAPADRTYGDQVTGGSQSISGSYNTLRVAGATARMMLVAAAAQLWDVDVDSCIAQNGAVIHEPTGDVLPYGDLAETAATLDAPGSGDVVVKDPSTFRIIGTRIGNWDNQRFVIGEATFTSDLQLEGMLVAVVERPPILGAKVAQLDSSAAEAVPGVRSVITFDSDQKVAIVADNTWAALQGRDAVVIEWSGGKSDLSTTDLRQELANRFEQKEDDNELKIVYDIAYMAHAPMEPMTCVADVREDRCEVWAPTQDRQDAKRVARSVSGLPDDAVTIHVPLIGGAFGRRLKNDYVDEAVKISQAVGALVKVFWTRADDIQHDFYHPMTARYMQVKLDSPKDIRASTADGYALPTGAWRSVANHPDAFAHECFVDEIAEALGRDPLDFQLELHENSPRGAVLELAAEKAGWGDPLPEGWGRGIAVHSTFGVTHVAQVVEASIDEGRINVHRVVCAVDCGIVVNPDGVEAQMEGGIVFGLSAALYGEITAEGGAVQQSNFHDYQVLRLSEMPEIEVYIVNSDRQPTGTGEMGVPPAAPALANALYTITGKRIRHLPIRPDDLL